MEILEMKIKWWHIGIGAGILIASSTILIVASKKRNYLGGEVLVERKYGNLTTNLLKVIQSYADKHGVPLQLALATIDIESGYNPNAYNPNCSDGTRTHGVRIDKIPYVICDNNSYSHHNTLMRRAEDKAWFEKKWKVAIDKNNPEAWGAIGLTQIFPDVSWRYGWSPRKRNYGLFDINRNLNAGIDKLGQSWRNNRNIADVRSTYAKGDKYEEWLASGTGQAERVVDKFIDRIEMYEDMFNLRKIRRYP